MEETVFSPINPPPDSLRDQFATAAIGALIQKTSAATSNPIATCSLAWKYADAMLATRGTPPPPPAAA